MALRAAPWRLARTKALWKAEKTEPRRKWLIYFLKKIGRTGKHELWELWKTLVTRSQETKIDLMASRVMFLKQALLICRMIIAFRKSKIITDDVQRKKTAWLTSVVWILLIKNVLYDQKNSRPWLKLMLMSRLVFVIYFICSVLALLPHGRWKFIRKASIGHGRR